MHGNKKTSLKRREAERRQAHTEYRLAAKALHDVAAPTDRRRGPFGPLAFRRSTAALAEILSSAQLRSRASWDRDACASVTPGSELLAGRS